MLMRAFLRTLFFILAFTQTCIPTHIALPNFSGLNPEIIAYFKNIKSPTRAPKKWTFMVYMAADNDLHYFAWKNIQQMERIGSNNQLNIVLQVNERGKKKPTQRYLVEKGNTVLIPMEKNSKLNTGDAQTLIDFCSWGITQYPAEHYCLVLWNHGTGILDPILSKNHTATDLFHYNSIHHLMELDRSIPFIEHLMTTVYNNADQRGVCFDETYRAYLDNQKIEQALSTICATALQGKKFDIIAFDACLMSMLEVAVQCRPYASIMIGSQEVELGAGWNYERALTPLSTVPLDPIQFARHIVHAYQETYAPITNDYTQSAVLLDSVADLERNVHHVAHLLIQALNNQHDSSVKNIIKNCRSRRMCTVFDEPSYIDLYHLYTNLLRYVDQFKFRKQAKRDSLRHALYTELTEGLRIIERTVIANVTGKNLMNARGISIYFPEQKIFNSYFHTNFGKKNGWLKFLERYLL